MGTPARVYSWQPQPDMATCPNCGRFLEAHHRCKGVWRLRLRVWSRIAAGGAAGGLIGAIAMATLFGWASLASVALSVAVGAVISWSFLRGG